MSRDLLDFFIAVGGALLIGMLSGALLMWFFRRNLSAPEPLSAPASATADDELLRVAVDPLTQQVRLHVDGRSVSSVEAIAAEPLRAQVRAVVNTLVGAQAAVETAPPAARTLAMDALPAVPPAADDIRGSFFDRMKQSFAPPSGYTTNGALRPARKPKAPVTEPAKPPDVFAQINAILQRKLREQPSAPRIEIVGEGAELRIWLDGQQYAGVDDVSDERARALIRAAVAEWESN